MTSGEIVGVLHLRFLSISSDACSCFRKSSKIRVCLFTWFRSFLHETGQWDHQNQQNDPHNTRNRQQYTQHRKRKFILLIFAHIVSYVVSPIQTLIIFATVVSLVWAAFMWICEITIWIAGIYELRVKINDDDHCSEEINLAPSWFNSSVGWSAALVTHRHGFNWIHSSLNFLFFSDFSFSSALSVLSGYL